jgi:prefoldin subunit 5
VYKTELKEVNEQLEDIEIQIEALLQTQADLTSRKEELEALIKTNSEASQSQANSQQWDAEGSQKV